MTFTVLMENSAQSGFLKEHGLSYHMFSKGKSLLLDSGSSGKFAKNAKKSGISLKEVDFSVLSHSHFDHSDGFRTFFQENSHAPLYLREEGLEGGHFSFSSGNPKFVGMHKDIPTNFSTRLHPVTLPCFPIVKDHIYLVAQPTSLHKNQKGGEEVYQKKLGWDQFASDDFSHQQSLVLLENDHLFLFNSCFHGDILEIVEHVLSYFPTYPHFTLFGGLHLPTNQEGTPLFSTDYVKDLGGNLQKIGLSQLYTGHCTSSLAFSMLKDSLGEQLHSLSSGSVLHL